MNGEIIAELDEVYAECREPGWDGYGAYPVTEQAYQRAKEIIERFPEGIPLPSISAEPDGWITLEWYESPRRLVSASVAPDGLNCVAVFDDTWEVLV